MDFFGLKCRRPNLIVLSSWTSTSTPAPAPIVAPPPPPPPLTVAPPALPPVGVVILDNRGQILGTESDLLLHPTLIQDNYTPTAADAANATLTTSQNILDAYKDPGKQTTLAQLIADSGGAAHNVLALGVFDMNNSKPGASFWDQAKVLGETFAAAIGGAVAAGPLGAVGGALSTFGTAEANLLKSTAVNPTDHGAFASGGIISEANSLGFAGKLVGLGATIDANSGSSVGGDLTESVPNDLGQSFSDASGLSMPTLTGVGNVLASGGSTSSIVGLGMGTLGDSGIALPDVSALAGLDLSELSDWASLNDAQKASLSAVVDFFQNNPTSQELDALQSIFNQQHTTATVKKTTTTAPGASVSPSAGTAVATQKPLNPLLLAGLLLLRGH